MKIKCSNCPHTETTGKDFFVKLIGGAMPVGGFWAWTSYLFAGTGFAMVIVAAIIGGGVAMLVFKDEIVEWIISQDYECSECGSVKWEAVTDTEEKSPAQIVQRRLTIAEDLLRLKGCEFEKVNAGWLVLRPCGDLKEIKSVDELEEYATSLQKLN